MKSKLHFKTAAVLAAVRTLMLGASLAAILSEGAAASVFFATPVSGDLYIEQVGGEAGAATTFGLGTSPADFVPYLTGLPNTPAPGGPVLIGFFTAGTSINFGMYTTFFDANGWAFSNRTDQPSIEAFTDTTNNLGLGGSIMQPTGPYTWLLHLDDALSTDNDNNDILIQLSIRPVVAAVPELSTWAMMLLGFAGVGFLSYRRRKRVTAA
jgi:hypothetical protein